MRGGAALLQCVHAQFTDSPGRKKGASMDADARAVLNNELGPVVNKELGQVRARLISESDGWGEEGGRMWLHADWRLTDRGRQLGQRRHVRRVASESNVELSFELSELAPPPVHVPARAILVHLEKVLAVAAVGAHAGHAHAHGRRRRRQRCILLEKAGERAQPAQIADHAQLALGERAHRRQLAAHDCKQILRANMDRGLHSIPVQDIRLSVNRLMRIIVCRAAYWTYGSPAIASGGRRGFFKSFLALWALNASTSSRVAGT
eukprot:6200280-Pleurochrysis_carterae.AAC.2